MKKIIKLASILLISIILLASCSSEKTMDGKTANTKKQMSSAEYTENRKAIQSVSMVEAYAIANSEKAVVKSSEISKGELVFTFDGTETVSTSVVSVALIKKANATENVEEKDFYNSLVASLPKTNTEVKIKAGSYVNFSVDEKGIALISSLDITIVIDGKTIEIEKDADDKWIKIDDTFFDNTQLEKMLDAAEDAAESIEEFFTNFMVDLENLKTIIEEKAQTIKGSEFGSDIVAEGSYSFSFENNVFVATFNYEYHEKDEESEMIKVDGTLSFSFDSLDKAFNALFGAEGFDNFIKEAKDTIDVNIKVNGMEVWADAFLDELD